MVCPVENAVEGAADIELSVIFPRTQASIDDDAISVVGKAHAVGDAAVKCVSVSAGGEAIHVVPDDQGNWVARDVAIPVDEGPFTIRVDGMSESDGLSTVTHQASRYASMPGEWLLAMDPMDSDSAYVFAESNLAEDRLCKLELSTGHCTPLFRSQSRFGGQGDNVQHAVGMVVDRGNNDLVILSVTGGVHRLDLQSMEMSQISAGTPEIQITPGGFVTGDDGTGVRAYVLDGARKQVQEIDLATGEVTVLSSNEKGEGPGYERPEVLAYDRDTSRLYLLDVSASQVLEVDPASGDRVVLSSLTEQPGPGLISPGCMAVDAASARLMIAEQAFDDVIVAVELTGENRGQRAAFSRREDPAVTLERPRRMVIDTASQNILIIDNSFVEHSRSIIAVNLADGTRAVAFARSVGVGPRSDRASALAVDLEADQAYVTTGDIMGGIINIDLATGERRFVLDQASGEPAPVKLGKPVFDPLRNRLVGLGFVEEVVSLDLASGAVELLSSDESDGSSIATAVALALDEVNNRAFVAARDFNTGEDTDAGAVYEIDLTTGSRRLLSGRGAGSGAPFTGLLAVAYDRSQERLVVTDAQGGDFDSRSVFSVSVETGERRRLSRVTAGGNDLWSYPEEITVDQEGRIFVGLFDSIIEIPPAGGAPQVVSGFRKGNGPSFLGQVSIVADSERGVLYTAAFDQYMVFEVDRRTGDRTIVSR